FCLYHGNLSVTENEKAAFWLLENVINVLELPFVIAGKNPSLNFEAKARKNENVCIIANPTQEELDDLIRKAQVNLLPSLNITGVKIKLLNALFNGRLVVTNKESVDGTGLENLCIIADSVEDFKEKTAQAFKASFTEADIHKRQNLLEKNYDNEANAEKLIQRIW
nr:glycosyltransferase family 4 protein [Bacteroidota bacterium]